ncbi:MAG: acyl carrier protein [Candidatus Neomarinimicrobiota bacterium]|nr:MAG: acyl carrier protein [Candidatus Neomarinimicrobiota bacterium]
MKDQLFTLIADELSVEKEQVTLEANLQDDLGADSLDAIQLIMSIENEFDITIPESDIDKLKTVADVMKYIESNK